MAGAGATTSSPLPRPPIDRTTYTYTADLVRVVDGDTVYLDIDLDLDVDSPEAQPPLDLGFHIWVRDGRLWRVNVSYRLLRINAPEMKWKSGKAAKAALAKFLGTNPHPLVAQTHKSDVYGRYLVELWAAGENVSDWLVAHHHAVYKEYE